MRDFAALFRAVGQNMQRWCGEWWAGQFMQTRLSRVGQGASTLDSVTMTDETADAPGAEIDLTRWEQFGDVVIAPTDTNAIVMRKADGGMVLHMGQPSSRPTDGKTGDRGLYSSKAGTRVHLYGEGSGEPGAILATNATGARVKIEQDGAVRVDSAAGKNIVLNGGTHDNARESDGVWAGDLRVETETDGMSKDTLKVFFVTRDPQDPNYPLDQQLLEWTGPLGSAVNPPPGNSITVKLTGIITRGKSDVKS